MSSVTSSPQPPRAPAWSAPARARSSVGVVLAVIGILIGGVAFLLVLAYLALSLGVASVAVALVLALIPLAVLLLAVRWIDRWEPEPRGALWFALLWGGGVSVVLALVVDLGISVAGAGEATTNAEVLSTTVQAPIVEEIAKGLGVLILAFAGRRYLDGPVDGIVYAAVIAAGFTFTEDILYFGTTYVEQGAGGLAGIFVVREIFSPFAHMMFTACTGAAVGFAVQRTRGAGILGYWALGLVPAMLLHALWNSAGFFVSDFFAYYLLVQVPFFLIAVVLVILLRRREAHVTRVRLEEYAAAGWFLPGEIDWLATPSGRRRARAWARAQPGGKSAAMQRFTRDATKLAFARQRVVLGRADIGQQDDERELLNAIVADRHALLA
ncbi:PrsW family intramembrane metalloprotease [Rathayibacter sp. YIM 133350]|uniref:PrsW family intramembrane metalloprotease n=1 Tax=Rathayibacter sp. YIM 133350 TaxID=3131992 RepID=UPI00307E2BEE